MEEFNEYLDYLWAPYVIHYSPGIIHSLLCDYHGRPDLNDDLGNFLGDKGCYAPNDRGLRLLDFANYFNLCPINGH